MAEPEMCLGSQLKELASRPPEPNRVIKIPDRAFVRVLL